MPRIRANGIQLYYELAGPADRPIVMLSNSLGTRRFDRCEPSS